jgi:hypothetical protein
MSYLPQNKNVFLKPISHLDFRVDLFYNGRQRLAKRYQAVSGFLYGRKSR